MKSKSLGDMMGLLRDTLKAIQGVEQESHSMTMASLPQQLMLQPTGPKRWASASDVTDQARRGTHTRNASKRLDENRDGLSFSTQVSTAKAKGRRMFANCFTIYSGLCARAGFKLGDNVNYQWDVGDRTGRIYKVDRSRWSLYRYGKNSKDLGFKVQWYPEMPSIPQLAYCESVSVTDEGILFVFPPETSFGELVRK